MPTHLISSTAKQIELLSREKTVFFFPVGPIEDHGPHLPVGLDIFEAERVCEITALRLEKEMPGWSTVLMPSVPLGIDGNTTHFALTVRAHVLRDWLVDAVSGLNKLGFRHFACVSGHLGPRQLTALEDAGKLVSRKNFFGLRGKSYLVSLSSALANSKKVRTSPFWPDFPEHGGDRDTSVAIFVSPELVQAIAPNLPPLERESSFFLRFLSRLRGKTSGYWGDPRKASAEKGQSSLNQMIDVFLPRLRARMMGEFAPNAFRSWYSVIPSNRSFFKSWMIAVAILLVLAFWAQLLVFR